MQSTIISTINVQFVQDLQGNVYLRVVWVQFIVNSHFHISVLTLHASGCVTCLSLSLRNHIIEIASISAWHFSDWQLVIIRWLVNTYENPIGTVEKKPCPMKDVRFYHMNNKERVTLYEACTASWIVSDCNREITWEEEKWSLIK